MLNTFSLPSPQDLIWKFGLYVFLLPALLIAGYAVARESNFLLLLVISFPALVVMIRASYMSLIFAWAFFILIPYDVFRVNLPLLSSPLMVIAMGGLGFSVIQIANRIITPPPSRIYRPAFLWIGVLLLFVLFGHGEHVGIDARWRIQGMWGLFLVLTTVHTPQQAKLVLGLFILFFLIRTVFLLPTILRAYTTVSQEDVSYLEIRSENDISFHFPQMVALVIPICFSLMLRSDNPLYLRFLGLVASGIFFLFITMSGYGMPVFTMLAALSVVGVLSYIYGERNNRVILIFLVGMFIIFAVNFIGVQIQVDRILSGKDVSMESRMEGIVPGIHAFMERPLFGWGAWESKKVPYGIFVYTSHNSILETATRYGLVGLSTLFILFGSLALQLYRLNQKKLSPLERSLVAGITGTFCAYVLQGTVSVSVGIITWDSVFWFLMGLGMLWLSWLDNQTYDELVAA